MAVSKKEEEKSKKGQGSNWTKTPSSSDKSERDTSHDPVTRLIADDDDDDAGARKKAAPVGANQGLLETGVVPEQELSEGEKRNLKLGKWDWVGPNLVSYHLRTK